MRAFKDTAQAGEQMKGRVESSLQKVSARLDDVGRSMQRAGAVVTAGLTVPILAGANAAVNAAADYGDAINRTRVLLGAAADDAIAFANSLLESHGLGKRAALDMVAKFSAMLIAQGKTKEEALALAKSYTKLAADAASFHDLPHEEVQAAIQAGLRGEYEQLEKLDVFMRESDVTRRALIDTGKEQESQLTAVEKAAARQALIMEGLSVSEGDFARTSKDVNNAARVQAERLDDLKTEIGKHLIPAKKALLDVGDRILALFEGLSPAGQKLALVVAGLAAAVGPLLVVLGTLARSISSLIDLHLRLAPKIATAARGVSSFAVTTARAAASVARATARMIVSFARMSAQAALHAGQAAARVAASVARQVAAWALLGAKALLHAAKVAAAWLIALGPIGLVIAAVAGVVALIVRHWDTIKRVTVDLWNKVKDTWLRGWQIVKDSVVGGIASVVNFFRELPGKVVGAIGDLAGSLYRLGVDALESLARGLGSIVGRIVRIATDIRDKIVAKLNPANWFSTPADHYRELWGEAFQAIADEGQDKLSSIKGTIASIKDETTPSFLAASARGRGGGGAFGSSTSETNFHTPVNIEVHKASQADVVAGTQRALRLVATSWGT